MKTVRENLELCDKDKLLDIYIKKYSVEKEEYYEQEREDVAKWLEKLLSSDRTSKREDDLILAPLMSSESNLDDEDTYDEWLDVVGYEPKDINECEVEDSILNLSDSEIDTYTSEQCDVIGDKLRDMPSGYAIEFSDWVDILEFYVAETCIEMYSREEVLAGILNEMLFFGFEESKMIDEREELVRRAEEVKKYDELPEEERKEHFKDFDLVLKEIGFEDTRTQEEKDASQLKHWRNCIKNLIRKANMLKKLKRELNS